MKYEGQEMKKREVIEMLELRLDTAKAEIELLEFQNRNLDRWKEEATQVIADWEKIGQALDFPGKLGESKAAATLQAVNALKLSLASLPHLQAENEKLAAHNTDLMMICEQQAERIKELDVQRWADRKTHPDPSGMLGEVDLGFAGQNADTEFVPIPEPHPSTEYCTTVDIGFTEAMQESPDFFIVAPEAMGERPEFDPYLSAEKAKRDE